MIRPWYRSRLFWLGLPGLLFLVWGWIDRSPSSSLTATVGTADLSVGNESGSLRVRWQRNPVGLAIAGQDGDSGTRHCGTLPQGYPVFRVDHFLASRRSCSFCGRG
ncbi:hypothetical protein [Luteolibacter soli]|uniref:hypothetical protein n=1 Tax=Luteolibacter soli TaxID=3135280 RepID=UPI00311A568E